MKFRYSFLLLLITAILLAKCARKGRPTGGPKDETAPILVIANPPYESTNFKKDEIKIEFDEYIVLKNLTKQLIVSPPLKNPAVITPQGTPSKYLKIKLLDTLQQNTTYTFNFGNAIQDNNESNKIESFKYVFSTGDYIDSLTVKGTVADALKRKLKKNISVLLYRLDTTYNDSIPLKQKPSYVTNTADSLNFKFTNIKEGKYAIMAIDEETKDYIFNPKKDKIGFLTDTISLPKDSVLTTPITIFKETQPFKFKRGREIVKGKIQFGFTGDKTGMKLKLLSTVPKTYKSFQQFEKEKDTLNYWFTPIKTDSLNFIVSKNNFLDTITVKLRKKKIDSLSVSSSVSGILHLNDTLFFNTNNPITLIDKKQFLLVDKDTVAVPFTLKEEKFNKLALVFNKQPKQKYNLKVLPNAITDLYQTTNDTLQYSFNTKDPEDYGEIILNVQNEAKNPVIIQLLSNNKVLKSEFLTASKKINFKLLELKEYTIRAIIDENNNKIWDTGNFLTKTQPERIVYFSQEIKLRANWIFNETFLIR